MPAWYAPVLYMYIAKGNTNRLSMCISYHSIILQHNAMHTSIIIIIIVFLCHL